METETAACCCAERGVEVQGCQEHSQEGAGQRGGGGAWRQQQQQAPAGTDVLKPVPSLLQGSGVSKKGCNKEPQKVSEWYQSAQAPSDYGEDRSVSLAGW